MKDNNWISVDAELPREAPVLVCYLEPSFGHFSKELGVAYFDHDDYYEGEGNGQGWLFWLNDIPIVGGGVTHWCKLPTPPEDS